MPLLFCSKSVQKVGAERQPPCNQETMKGGRKSLGVLHLMKLPDPYPKAVFQEWMRKILEEQRNWWDIYNTVESDTLYSHQ